MKDVRIRLLYPSTVRPEEVRSAMSGMERFRAYGVLHDSTDINAGGPGSLKGVRNVRTMKWLLNAENPSITSVDLGGGIADFFFSNRIIPVGLTPSRISESVSSEYSTANESRAGLSLEGEGAIVSLFRVRELAAGADMAAGEPNRAAATSALALDAIRLAVIHEVGHVLGVKGHCEKEGCVMQANRDFADFIERFVKAGADFCRDCSAKVNSAVCRMSMGP